jgi:hypothetical protein
VDDAVRVEVGQPGDDLPEVVLRNRLGHAPLCAQLPRRDERAARAILGHHEHAVAARVVDRLVEAHEVAVGQRAHDADLAAEIPERACVGGAPAAGRAAAAARERARARDTADRRLVHNFYGIQFVVGHV